MTLDIAPYKNAPVFRSYQGSHYDIFDLVGTEPAPVPVAADTRTNAERFPSLAASGFIFSEALEQPSVGLVKPAGNCECCGREREPWPVVAGVAR